MSNDDDLFSNFQDPFERLHDLEAAASNIAWHLEECSDQIKQQNTLLVKITENMKYLAASNSSLQQQVQSLHHRLKILENAKNEK